VHQVFSSGGSRIRTFSGVARSGIESKISFKVPGTIQRLAVNVGSRVSAGQLIAELDPEDFRLQVQDEEASLAQAKAQERNASATYDRVRGLYENRNASKQDLDAARATHESAAAAVESNTKRLELARRQLAYTKLKAPLDAAVAEVPVEVNENVSAGQVIALLTSGSDLEVAVAIPGVLIARIREGQPVIVTFDAHPGREFPARVTEVSVTSPGLATTFPVTVKLNESDPDVRSGMAAEVAFSFASQGLSERFHVPSVAVGEDRDGRFVFVVVPADERGVGVVRRKQVTTGQLTDDGLEILSGVSDGDFVVTGGVSKLVDSQTVKFEGAEE
jgi:RND family efflux transporter MFP subunit